MMNRTFIKGIFFTMILVLWVFTWTQAQESNSIKLPDPTKKGGLSIMESFSNRASERSWADRELSSQDLSNLLWAANGINRPDSKKRTAPSARNSQDVDIYILIKSGAYVYDAANHALNLVSAGDHRSEIGRRIGGPNPSGGAAAEYSTAAVNLIMVSDTSKLSNKETGIIDAALVSENISLFCAGNGLANVPRTGSISNIKDTLKTLLKLKDTQYIVIENAVGYPVETK